MDDGKVYRVSQTRDGPASPGKQKTTLRVRKAQAREQVRRERQEPLQTCSLELPVPLLGNSHQDGQRAWTGVQGHQETVHSGYTAGTMLYQCP